MAAEFVVGLFRSRGIAEDACHRLRTEGVPDGAVFYQMLREVAPLPSTTEGGALSMYPRIWDNVRDTYVSYMHNGETVVLVLAATAAEIELASDVLRMFEPLVVELLTLELES
jgi:hypothetical protein